MAYFKIGSNDYSSYTSGLKITRNTNYNAQTNAAGDTVVDYINQKRKIEVEIIALDETIANRLKADIDAFDVRISFRNPKTKALETNVECIIPSNAVDYYTIQADKVMLNKMTLTFTEL